MYVKTFPSLAQFPNWNINFVSTTRFSWPLRSVCLIEATAAVCRRLSISDFSADFSVKFLCSRGGPNAPGPSLSVPYLAATESHGV